MLKLYSDYILQSFPSRIQDISSGSPLILSGRYSGTFPELVKVSGTLADMTNFVVDLKVKREKDIQLSNVISHSQGITYSYSSYLIVIFPILANGK